MRRNIYLYLFIFATLIALVLFMNSSRTFKKLEADLRKAEISNIELSDSINKLNNDLLDLQYFALSGNDDALEYFVEYGLKNPSGYIADKLMETNKADADNPLVPYEGMNNFFQINKVKVLNHRWIIANYTDGKYWGELYIRYELREDLSINFEVLDYLLYTRS